MSVLSNIFYKSLAENEKNISFWEDYLKNLLALDFNIFSDKLKVPVLVPIGSKILFRGELKHTNEVTVALGADYFVKCSLKQAEVLRQHRIQDAQTKLNTYKNEKEYLENQLSFCKQNVTEDQCQEIIEMHTYEEDKAWRERHKENVKKYIQNKSKNSSKEITNVEESNKIDEALWNRLEELELQEELENELLEMKDAENLMTTANKSFIIDEKDVEDFQIKYERQIKSECTRGKIMADETTSLEETSKLDLLKKVIDKQSELEDKLLELRNKERSYSKTEKDLISRLDEMEQLDALEDEMDRLDDIIEAQDIEKLEDENINTSSMNLKKSVSFADEDNSETLELNFKHTSVETSEVPYDPEKGIQKPSDIYEAFSNLFGSTTSILKKSKFNNTIKHIPDMKISPRSIKLEDTQKNVEVETIVVKDVIEKTEQKNDPIESENRPTSLFKKKRQQMKTIKN